MIDISSRNTNDKKEATEKRPVAAFKSLSFRGKRGYASNTFNMKRDTTIATSTPRTFGGILRIREEDGTEKYAIVQGRYTGKWSFPKGHSEKDESPLDCSEREIGEETSIDVLPPPTAYVKMCYGHYYIFDLKEAVRLIPRDTCEIMDTKWVTIEEMGRLLLNADASMYLRQKTEEKESTRVCSDKKRKTGETVECEVEC